MDSELSLVTFFLNCFGFFFSMFNPLAVMPVFMTMTAGFPHGIMRAAAVKVIVTASIASVVFAFLGPALLKALGISIPGLCIAGGIIIFMIGYSMLFGITLGGKQESAQAELKHDSNFAVTPLGIPLFCGPAALTSVAIQMTLAEQLTSFREHSFATYMIVVFIALACVMGVSFAIFIASRQVHRMLGENGMKVFAKIMGLVLCLIAAQLMIRGVADVVHQKFGVPLVMEVAHDKAN